MTSLISFLGGGIFRMLWGEISHYLTARQDHMYQLQQLALQEQIDAAEHARKLDGLRLQSELGQQMIRVKAEADIQEIEAQAWGKAAGDVTKTIGIPFVDKWNAVIRPGVATWSIVMMTSAEAFSIVLSENTLSICGAALGLYLVDRNLMKRGK